MSAIPQTPDDYEDHIRVRPIIGGRSVPWLVSLSIDDAAISLRPAEARQVAAVLVEIAAVCEYDDLVYRVLTDKGAFSVQEARELLEELAKARDRDWDDDA